MPMRTTSCQLSHQLAVKQMERRGLDMVELAYAVARKKPNGGDLPGVGEPKKKSSSLLPQKVASMRRRLYVAIGRGCKPIGQEFAQQIAEAMGLTHWKYLSEETDYFAELRHDAQAAPDKVREQLPELADQLGLLEGFLDATRDGQALASFLHGEAAVRLLGLAENGSSSPYGAASAFLLARVFLRGSGSLRSDAKVRWLRRSLALFQRIRQPCELPFPVLLPGIRSESPDEAVQENASMSETRVVPVPWRFMMSAAIALAVEIAPRFAAKYFAIAEEAWTNAGSRRHPNCFRSVNLDLSEANPA
jgi:hypothetical protein